MLVGAITHYKVNLLFFKASTGAVCWVLFHARCGEAGHEKLGEGEGGDWAEFRGRSTPIGRRPRLEKNQGNSRKKARAANTGRKGKGG